MRCVPDLRLFPLGPYLESGVISNTKCNFLSITQVADRTILHFLRILAWRQHTFPAFM